MINSSSRFVVSFTEADHHVIDVQLWLRAQGTTAIELVFPVWTPGSYMIREYARNVETLTATAHEHPGEAIVGDPTTVGC